MIMKLTFLATCIFVVLIIQCNKGPDENNNNNNNQDVITIKGFQMSDVLGNDVAYYGVDEGKDWLILNWSQLTQVEQSFLNFPDNVNLNNTVVTSLSRVHCWPNPAGQGNNLLFSSADSVKVKVALVNSQGIVFYTHAVKMKGTKIVAFDVSNTTTFPDRTNLRYYFSFSAMGNENFKAGFGDLRICRLSPMDYIACFN
jgi:hypothetical protein